MVSVLIFAISPLLSDKERDREIEHMNGHKICYSNHIATFLFCRSPVFSRFGDSRVFGEATKSVE